MIKHLLFPLMCYTCLSTLPARAAASEQSSGHGATAEVFSQTEGRALYPDELMDSADELTQEAMASLKDSESDSEIIPESDDNSTNANASNEDSPLYPEEVLKAIDSAKLEENDLSLFKFQEDTPDVVSIQEALELTYMQNSQLDSARAALRATDEDVAIAVSGWRPAASIQFRQTQKWSMPSGSTRTNTGAVVKRKNTHNYDSAVQLSGEQNVFAGGSTYAQTQSAKERVYAGRFNLLSTEQQVLTEAARVFLDVITNETIAELRKSSENFLLKTWEQTQVRYEVGEVTRTEVEAAKASYLGARSERISAEANVETARANYKRIVGSPAGKLGKAEILGTLPNTLEEAQQLAIAHNPSILQASHNVDAAKYEVNRNIGSLLPSIDVSANIGRNRNGGSNVSLDPQRQTTAEFLTTVSVPLYRRGESRAQIRKSHQQVAQGKVDLVTAKREATSATTSSWESLEASRNQVESLIAQVQAAKLAVEGVSEEANVGTKNILDVLEQEDRLVTSQINLVQAENRLVLAGYQVLAAVGRLTALDLNFNVKHYDPEKYYDEHSGAFFKSWKGEDYRYVKDQNEDDN